MLIKDRLMRRIEALPAELFPLTVSRPVYDNGYEYGTLILKDADAFGNGGTAVLRDSVNGEQNPMELLVHSLPASVIYSFLMDACRKERETADWDHPYRSMDILMRQKTLDDLTERGVAARFIWDTISLSYRFMKPGSDLVVRFDYEEHPELPFPYILFADHFQGLTVDSVQNINAVRLAGKDKDEYLLNLMDKKDVCAVVKVTQGGIDIACDEPSNDIGAQLTADSVYRLEEWLNAIINSQYDYAKE